MNCRPPVGLLVVISVRLKRKVEILDSLVELKQKINALEPVSFVYYTALVHLSIMGRSRYNFERRMHDTYKKSLSITRIIYELYLWLWCCLSTAINLSYLHKCGNRAIDVHSKPHTETSSCCDWHIFNSFELISLLFSPCHSLISDTWISISAIKREKKDSESERKCQWCELCDRREKGFSVKIKKDDFIAVSETFLWTHKADQFQAIDSATSPSSEFVRKTLKKRGFDILAALELHVG